MTTFRIGIDLGGTKIEAAALDDRGAIHLRQRVPTPAGDYAGTIAAIAQRSAPVRSGIPNGLICAVVHLQIWNPDILFWLICL